MQRTRTLLRSTTVALSTLALSLGLVGLVGCDKGSSSGGGGSAAGMIESMPAGTTAVVGLSFDKLRSTKQFKENLDKAMSDAPAEYAKAKDVCGMDPVEQISSVVIAVPADPENQKDQIFVTISGKFEESKVNECLPKLVKEFGEEGDQINIEKEGKLTRYSSEKGDKAYAYWANANTVVFSVGGMESQSPEPLAAMLNGEKLEGKAAVMDMVGKADTSAALWFAGAVPDGMSELAGPMFASMVPKQGYGTLDVSKGMDLKIALIMQKEDAANGLVGMINGMGLPQVKQMPQAQQFMDVIDALKIEAKGDTVNIGLKLTQEQMDKIAKEAEKNLQGGL